MLRAVPQGVNAAHVHIRLGASEGGTARPVLITAVYPTLHARRPGLWKSWHLTSNLRFSIIQRVAFAPNSDGLVPQLWSQCDKDLLEILVDYRCLRRELALRSRRRREMTRLSNVLLALRQKVNAKIHPVADLRITTKSLQMHISSAFGHALAASQGQQTPCHPSPFKYPRHQ